MEPTPHVAAARPPKDVGQDIIQPERQTTQSLVSASEIDQQVATAHRYPRSIRSFIDEAMAMATLNERVAEECFYVLPARRGGDGKQIEGPSSRLAEIIANAWGHCRVGARIVAEEAEFVTAQAVFHDLQKNVAITFEVRRRITTSKGVRFGTDMIGVTGNAACSIALRNVVLKGVPKAFWNDIYLAARQCAIGNVKTIASRRSELVSYFGKMGVRPEQIFLLLEIKGHEDITGDMMLTLRGVANAIKDGDTTPEDAFPPMPAGVARTASPQPQPAAPLPPAPEIPAAKTTEAPAPQPATPDQQPEPKKVAPSASGPPPAEESDYGGQSTPRAKPAPAKTGKTSATEDLGWGEL